MAAILTRMIGPESPAHVMAGAIALALGTGFVTAFVVGLITGMIVAFLFHPILVTLRHNDRRQGDRGLCHQRRSHRRLSARDPVSGQWHLARILSR